MRTVILAAVALGLLLCSCRAERAQAAADTHARCDAAMRLIDQARAGVDALAHQAQAAGLGEAMPAFVAIATRLSGAQHLIEDARDSLPAASDVPATDQPKPQKTADDLAAHPEDDRPNPPPSGRGALVIGGIITAAGVGLTLLKYAAPLIPGFGTAWQVGADALYAVIQHRDAKLADAATYQTASAARDLTPVVQAIAAMPPEDLPPWLRGVLTADRRNAASQFVSAVAAIPQKPAA